MKTFRHFAATLLATSILLTNSRLGIAQSSNATATVQFGNGESVTITDFSSSIDLQPNETVTINFQFPSGAAGEPAIIEAPDGGVTSLGSAVAVVNDDGTLRFVFSAPAMAGEKTLNIRSGSQSYDLLFRVLASTNQ